MNDGMKKAKREGLRKRETKDRVMYVSAGESSLGERVCVCEVERAGHVYTCICCHMCYKKEKEKRKGQSQWRCLYVNKASGTPFHKGERERERERRKSSACERLFRNYRLRTRARVSVTVTAAAPVVGADKYDSGWLDWAEESLWPS